MIRFRVWDNQCGEYAASDSFYLAHNGRVVWYDGSPIHTPEEPDRYEVEFGNQYCFHNDIVETSIYGGCWQMERVGSIWNDEIPRNHRNLHVIKQEDGELHTIYFDKVARGIALLDVETMEFYMVGFTCDDRFYGYEGEEYQMGNIVVVGNARFDDTPFCKKQKDVYEYHIRQKEKRDEDHDTSRSVG
jgi:hypothetical protein